MASISIFSFAMRAESALVYVVGVWRRECNESKSWIRTGGFRSLIITRVMALNGGLKYFRLFVSILTYQKTVLSIEIFLCICNKNGMKSGLGHDGFPRAVSIMSHVVVPVATEFSGEPLMNSLPSI